MMCKVFLREKAKQTGRPRHKESATQRHVAAKPTQTPPPTTQTTIQLWTSHTPTVPHIYKAEPKEGKVEEEEEEKGEVVGGKF